MSKDKILSSAQARTLLANERTFLSWMRTSLGIMAFGFVVEKFALFIQEIGIVLSKQTILKDTHPPIIHESEASYFGIILVGFGTFMGLLAFFRYQKNKREIEQYVFHGSIVLAILLTITIVAIGAFLIYYLIIT